MAELTAYAPRLLLQWEQRYGHAKHRSIEGTLVFADVSGFTKLSEALARKSGKAGAEEMADVINYLFGELLMLAAVRGGEMLKYGGDAMLLFFNGEHHGLRAAAACADMQRRLRQIGRIDTGGAGVVRLRMSVGAHSGAFDFFTGGGHHRELVVAGPDTTVTVEMEAAADATEVLMSPAMAAMLPPRNVGPAKSGGFLLRGNPRAPMIETVPLSANVDPATFLAAPVLEHVSSDGAEPEHRLATVCFLQFLELDRLLGPAGRPDEAARRVEEVLTLVQGSFLEHGVSFLATDLAADGGKVMAAAGAPISHGDDEERMLRACRQVLDSSPALPVRIGLNRGHVFAGDVGPQFRRTYTTLGDVTNTAARVMGKAAGGQLFALRSVLDRSATRFDVVEQPPFLAKGKTEPLVPYSVGDATGERVDVSAEVPLLGRESEVDAVRRAVEAALESGGAVQVVAEDGMGKSRVAAAAVGTLGGTVLRASAHETRGAAYEVLGRLVPSAAECLASAPELAPWAPLIEMVHGHDVPPTPDIEMLEPAVRVQQLAEAVATGTAAVHGSPLVLVIDDLDAVDSASREVVRLLAGPKRRPGLTVVATAAVADDQLTGAVEQLGPLDDGAARALVRLVVGVPLLPQHVRSIIERGDGNPLFLTELARAYGADPAALPESVEATVAARIDELPAAPRHALRVAAVLGTSFDVDVVELLTGSTIDWLAIRDFVEVDASGAARFLHRTTQSAAYEGLPFRRRRELHARAGEELERRGASAGELSWHFLQAGDAERTWSAALQAADEAYRRYAYADAAVLYDRALQVERKLELDGETRADVWRRLGLSLLSAGDADAAERAYRTARRYASHGATLANLYLAHADIMLRAGRLSHAERWARRGLEIVQHSRDRRAIAQRSRLKAALGACRQQAGDLAGCRTWFREAAQDARRAKDGRAEMHACNYDHFAAVCRRDADRGHAGEEALRLANEFGTAAERGRVLNNIALDLQMEGALGGARELFEQAYELFGKAGSPVESAIAANNIGEIAIELAEWDRAESSLTEAYETFAAAGSWMAVAAKANLGTLFTRAGDLDRAATLIAEAAERASALKLSHLVADIEQRQAELDAKRSGTATPDRVHHGASAF